MTIGLVRSKLEEHRMRDAPLEVLEPGDRVPLGPFELELVHMAHSIPDSCAVVLRSELGPVLITGDYKFDQTPVAGGPADIARLAELGRDGVLLLCGDSTNADRPGMATSETVVGPNLEQVFERCAGRSARSRSRSCAQASRMCRGLRISWEMCARNSLLAWFARSASFLAASSSRVRVAISSSSRSRWARSSLTSCI